MVELVFNRRTISPKSKPPISGNNTINDRLLHSSSKKSAWQKYLLWGIVLCISFNIYFAISFHNILDQGKISPLNQLGDENDMNSRADLQSWNVESKSTKSVQHYSLSPYQFDLSQAEKALERHGHDILFQPLRAYVERPLNDTVPNTVDKGNLNEKKPKIEVGRPGKFYIPLPLREGGPDDVSFLINLVHQISITQ